MGGLMKQLCESGIHCHRCRTDRQFLSDCMRAYHWNGVCPKGIPTEISAAELPPLTTQAANAAKAAGRVLLAAAQGAPVFATKETQDARLAICHACDQWIEKRKRCAKCGCFTDKKIKLATESCPLGKWTVE